MDSTVQVALIALVGVLATAYVQWSNGRASRYKDVTKETIDKKDRELAEAHTTINRLTSMLADCSDRVATREAAQ